MNARKRWEIALNKAYPNATYEELIALRKLAHGLSNKPSLQKIRQKLGV